MKDYLQQVVVPIINWDTCKALMPSHMKDYQLCAGYLTGGMDACQGDSGGPLVCKQGSHWWQYGVVNYGFDCAVPNKPGVYADVVKFLPWVYEKTGGQLLLCTVTCCKQVSLG